MALCLSSGLSLGTHYRDQKDFLLQNHAMLMAGPMARYRNDCWQKRPVALTQQAKATVHKVRFPGAGLSEVEPYSTVFMDGYLQVACVKDYMYEHGDKFGNNKFAYEIGSSANVSIVHYTEVVAREDQKSMTHEVCFEFCRTVPEMLFFGITQGRDCYCAPYYESMAGDSSMCDAVCEGAPSTMCGGMKKSSVFAMHSCNDAAEELEEAISAMEDAALDLKNVSTTTKTLADDGQTAASDLQKKLGAAGDPVAADLMQSAMVFAGELVHPADEGIEFAESLTDVKSDATDTVSTLNTGDFASATKAEEMTHEVKQSTAEAEAKIEELEGLLLVAHPTYPAMDDAPNATAQYMPLMYFVDKEFEGVPSTCGGDVVKKPIFGLDSNGCAMACDAEIHSCVGFSYFPDGVCFLISKFTSVQYYTGCGKEGFLQVSKREGLPAECFAKFSSFEGVNLTPDPSGKCDLCLKTATKAERCF